MKNTTQKAPRIRSLRAMLLLCAAALLTAVMGCTPADQKQDESPDFNAMGEAIALSLDAYQEAEDSVHMSTLEAMDEITWYTSDGGELKLSEIDQQMASAQAEDPSAVGTAFEAFCGITGTGTESFLYPAESDPTLEEALKLRVNDLTGRMYSVGVPGARVMINAMYEEGYLIGDADSDANYAPKITLQARAIVEEISQEENRTGQLSGEIDYQAEGGYFEVLCKALGVADKNLYSKLQDRAAQAAGQDEAETELTDEEEELYAALEYYNYRYYSIIGAEDWHGAADEDKEAMAQELLDLFAQLLGQGPLGFSAGEFAGMIDGAYADGTAEGDVWHAACAVTGIDGSPYEALFQKAAGY